MSLRRVVFLGVAVLILFVFVTNGQICRGSRLTYIVRDSHGRAIDADKNGFTFAGNNGSDLYKWSTGREHFLWEGIKQVPDDVTRMDGKVVVFGSYGMCNFKEPLKLKLIYRGKTMDLTFLMPRMDSVYSADFVIDSLPFRAGKYQIKIETGFHGPSGFYPASGWKKVQ